MKKNKSFTIVEVMISMSIFILVVGGSIVLIQQTLVMISIAKQKLTAYYLAQEGIELVRNIRDTNWLEHKTNPAIPWYDGFPVLPFNSNPNDHTLDFDIDYDDTMLNSSLGAGGRYLSLNSNNGYSYNANPACTKATQSNCTIFVRWVRIGQYGPNGGYLVECHVEWKERRRTQSVVVKEMLYDWYGQP